MPWGHRPEHSEHFDGRGQLGVQQGTGVLSHFNHDLAPTFWP